MNDVEFYGAQGHYAQNGGIGKQEGGFALYQEGRVFGKVQDKGGIIQSKPKICLGIYKKGDLNLLKVPIEEPIFAPIVWNLHKVDENKEGLQGRFEGKWLAVYGLEGVVLHNGVAIAFTQNPRELIAFDLYPMKELFERMNAYIDSEGQEGELSFERVGGLNL